MGAQGFAVMQYCVIFAEILICVCSIAILQDQVVFTNVDAVF